ncbi:acyl-CoA thioester hydrolase/BAAT C-terminal domain-containing protein [Algoriphagus sp. A40]|uniref:acyl-CoA thioester hydrolase/BAAT C-terminal domain-containing protein n=1 Tax=Algoriphagus sp. A40 TaxID=1945863 RepID=UPI000986F9CB|nr:acyl-CoA thioester hydrolase/BAAT C-terminal domain-containing protein [Algoriphagus sp. A40]OOG78286.1 hypothetical protein B0E43_02480 [Algoriphagus sp. A40]
MNNLIFKRILVAFLVFVVFGFLVIYQEFRPVDSSELSIEQIRNGPFVADFIYPSDQGDLPVILFLGGSGGGLRQDSELKLLALEGFAVMSLAYFKEPGLPDKLENIPLEYFKTAMDWLTDKPQIDPEKIVLMGVSRGAELALLLGSIYPQVKGVIAYTPSCFVLPNATEITNDTLVPSWTLNGKPVAFATIKRFEDNSNQPINYKTYVDPLLVEGYLQEESVIKVEKINGPILLISGAKDLVWPASEMATKIESRLLEKGFKHEFKNSIFGNGGHDVFMIKNCIPLISSVAFKKIHLKIREEAYEFNLGGTTFGIIWSKIQSRKQTLEFLEMIKNQE